MNLFTAWFSNFFYKKYHLDKKNRYIFYKIVDSHAAQEYILQCINTNAYFRAAITDIVFDSDLLYGLHPIQACYIGLEYAKYIKQFSTPAGIKKVKKSNLKNYPTYRYGKYYLSYQNRSGELSFINIITNDELVMDPLNISITKELISEFDAAQAFYIGLTAGIKLMNSSKNNRNKKPFLKIVTSN